MRHAIGVVAAIGLASSSGAQPSPDVLYLRDYTFDRLEATRTVSDAADKGTIRLVAYVWKPTKSDRHEVVLFSHGSTGGMAASPKEPGGEAPPRPLLQFLLARGYSVVAAIRRGRGPSTGTYVEECSTYAGKCTLPEQLALTDAALASAMADDNAIIDQLILGKIVPANSRIILMGQSRGGFLSFLLAAQRPDLVKGVINFVGGWHRLGPPLSDADVKLRLDDQTTRLAAAAKKTSAPTISFYAARDPFYADSMPAKLLNAWREAGGKAEFFFVSEHTMPNPHNLILATPAHWSQPLDAFLKALDASLTGRGVP
jgi:pimeloyl-ACP methyl ester carboxylesterase